MKLMLVSAVLIVASCGTGTQGGGTSKASNPYGLIQVEHAPCQEAGNTAATYLDTGRPTDLDAAWGNQRQQVLQLTGERRALYIRQQADGYIQQCDQAASEAEAAAAAAKAAAEAQAQQQAQEQAQAAHQAQVQAKEQDTCKAAGGTWDSNCQIKYRSLGDGQPYNYEVTFDAEGNVIPQPCGDSAVANCLHTTLDPATARADCLSGRWNPGFQSMWHPDTDICSI